jgi:putative membrane protein
MRGRSLLMGVAALGMLSTWGCQKKEEKSAKVRDQGQERAKLEDANPDHRFMATAARANLSEIAAGRLALAQSASSEVKKFAQRMVEDHTQANRELGELAQKMSFSLPGEPDETRQKGLDHLSALRGVEFDRAFAGMMVSDHAKAVALFEESSKTSADPQVRSYSERTLPMLQDHLKMARDLRSQVGATPSAY